MTKILATARLNKIFSSVLQSTKVTIPLFLYQECLIWQSAGCHKMHLLYCLPTLFELHGWIFGWKLWVSSRWICLTQDWCYTDCEPTLQPRVPQHHYCYPLYHHRRSWVLPWYKSGWCIPRFYLLNSAKLDSYSCHLFNYITRSGSQSTNVSWKHSEKLKLWDLTSCHLTGQHPFIQGMMLSTEIITVTIVATFMAAYPP